MSSLGVKLKSSGVHLLVAGSEPTIAHSPISVRQRRGATYPVAQSEKVEVRQFHMKSRLFSRFATVTIDSEVVNVAEREGQEVTFQVQVPEAAFMSNFTMVVDGRVHVAQVLEKNKAEERYQQAKERNQTAAQVKQVPLKMERGMELFQISINLSPQATATFTLLYNELLERRSGLYWQMLVVQPGAIVENLTVSTSFAERQGFTYFAYKLPGSDSRLTASSADNQTELRASITSRELIFRPTVEMQRQFDSKQGIHGEFVIYYSVTNEPDGGSIIVQNDYFAHFFAPAELDSLPKNILFIIDISGSMSGEKIQQARQAMLKILDDLSTRISDTFNILLFDDKLELWQKSPASTLGSEIDAAKEFVQEKLKSRGATDIHGALIRGLNILLEEQETRSCDKASMIIFLTDGDPTSGITDPDRIINDVTSANNDRASIYSLGFGFNLNFNLLSKLSIRNRGLVRRIYAEADARDQLRDFYKEISTPVLCNVVASYSSDVVHADFLTLHDFPIYFEGKEIIVAGKIRHDDTVIHSIPWDAKLKAVGASGVVDFPVPAGQVHVVTQPGVEDDLTEKLWAYMKIKSLLRELERLDDQDDRDRIHARALNMSLTYGFVTQLTSFSIVVESVQDERRMGSMGSHPKRGMGGDIFYDSAPAGLGCVCRWSYGMVGWLLIGVLLLQ